MRRGVVLFCFFAKLVGVYSYYVFDTPDTFCMLTYFRRRGAEVFHFFITVLADPSAGLEVHELFGTEGQFFGGGGEHLVDAPCSFSKGMFVFILLIHDLMYFHIFSVLVVLFDQALCLFSGFLVEKKKPLLLLVLHQVPIYWGGKEGFGSLPSTRELLFTVNSRQWVFEKQPFFDFVVYLKAFFC